MKKLLAMLCAVLLVSCTGLPVAAADSEPVITFDTDTSPRARICTYTLPDGGVLYFAEPLEENSEIIPGWTLYESENLKGDIVIPEKEGRNFLWPITFKNNLF